MNARIFISLLAFSLACRTASAHEDFYVTRDFGNVKVRIETGFEYEEISKVMMLGELAEQMAAAMHYSGPVFLDFDHNYVGGRAPEFAISYGLGRIESRWGVDSVLTADALVIRQTAPEFKARTTLKLLEYAILNERHIKATQRQVEYARTLGKTQYTLKINSIDTLAIAQVLDTPNSALLTRTLNTRIDQPAEDFKAGAKYYLKDGQYVKFPWSYDQPARNNVTHGISYYWQNDQFFVQATGMFNHPDTVLLRLDNIYDFRRFEIASILVFDSDTSFYYVRPFNEPYISPRQVLHDTHNYHRPFKVAYLGGLKFSIGFSYYGTKEKRIEKIEGKDVEVELWGPIFRTFLYLAEENKLIDLDSLIKERPQPVAGIK